MLYLCSGSPGVPVGLFNYLLWLHILVVKFTGFPSGILAGLGIISSVAWQLFTPSFRRLISASRCPGCGLLKSGLVILTLVRAVLFTRRSLFVKLQIVVKIKNEKMREELTTAMHSEFSVDAETDLKHRVWAAVRMVENGTFSQEEALSAFGISSADYQKYSSEMPR